MPLLRTATLAMFTWIMALAPVAAQPATPRPGIEPCAVNRREVSAIVAILTGPAPATAAATAASDPSLDLVEPAAPQGAPIGTPRLLPPALPAGAPVAPETTAALTEVMQRYLACANGSDVIGLMSLVSDGFLRQTFGTGLLSEADLRAYAAKARPVAVASRRRLVAIRDSRRLEDGRIVALVDTSPLASTTPKALDTDLVTFALVDDQYLIDRFVAGVTVWYGPAASPAPGGP